MPTVLTTRAIHSEDASAAAKLVQAVKARPDDLIDPFPPGTEMEVLVDMGARGKGEASHPRVAVEDGVIVGYGAVDYSPEMRRALLLGPVVHPDHRCRGHGRRIVEDLLRQARAARQKHVRVSVGVRNKAAHEVLRRLGAKPRGRVTCVRLARPPQFSRFEIEGIRLERAEAEQGNELFDFTKRLVPRQAKQMRALLKSDRYCAILARRGGKVIGCVESDLRYGDTCTVENLEAPPSLLHKGLGNALLSEAIGVAFAQESIRFVEFCLPSSEGERLRGLIELGFEKRHELATFELKL